MKIHYLEIVTKDIDSVCNAYESSHSVSFGEADALLGGARTCTLPDGSILGVRAPMHSTEQPIVRPYWLVDDIHQAVAAVESQGAEIALPATEIPGKGTIAIYRQGGNDHGLWQR